MLPIINVIPLGAIASFLVPRLCLAFPWLGLLAVVVGTYPVFGESATLRAPSILITMLYGFIGLIIVVASARLRPAPFVPFGSIVTGLFYVVSFYAYLLPWGPPWGFHPWMLVFAWPGMGLIVYGGFLWQRHGLTALMLGKSGRMQLTLALAALMTLSSGAVLAYHVDPPRPGLGNFAVSGPDLPRIVEISPLVIEGTVVRKEFLRVKYRRPNGTVNNRLYTLYELVVSDHWRGSIAERILVSVPDFSPIALTAGQHYLLFLSEPASEGERSGYSSLTTPQRVWTREGNNLHPYPGVAHLTSITQDELVEALAQYPIVTSGITGG